MVLSSLILLDVSVKWQDTIQGCIPFVAVILHHLLHIRGVKVVSSVAQCEILKDWL